MLLSIAYLFYGHYSLQSPSLITTRVFPQVGSWENLTETISLLYEIDREVLTALESLSSQEEPIEDLVSARSRLNASVTALNQAFTTSHAYALKMFDSASRENKEARVGRLTSTISIAAQVRYLFSSISDLDLIYYRLRLTMDIYDRIKIPAIKALRWYEVVLQWCQILPPLSLLNFLECPEHSKVIYINIRKRILSTKYIL